MNKETGNSILYLLLSSFLMIQTYNPVIATEFHKNVPKENKTQKQSDSIANTSTILKWDYKTNSWDPWVKPEEKNKQKTWNQKSYTRIKKWNQKSGQWEDLKQK